MTKDLLAERFAIEINLIQQALGEKAGEIPYSMAIGISSLVLCFIKGWALTLSVIGIIFVLCMAAAAFFRVYAYHKTMYN